MRKPYPSDITREQYAEIKTTLETASKVVVHEATGKGVKDRVQKLEIYYRFAGRLPRE